MTAADAPASALQREAIAAWIGQQPGPAVDQAIAEGAWPRGLVCELIAALDEPDRSTLGRLPIAVRSEPSLRAYAASYVVGGVHALDLNLGMATGLHGVLRAFAPLFVKRASAEDEIARESITFEDIGHWAGHELAWLASPAQRPSPLRFDVTSNQRCVVNDLSRGAVLFVLAHELGHIAARHTEPGAPEPTGAALRGREFIADAAGLRTLIKFACSPDEDFEALFAGAFASLAWAELCEAFGAPRGADHPRPAARQQRLMRAARAVGAVPDKALNLARQLDRMFADLRASVVAHAPDARLADGRTRAEAARASVGKILDRLARRELDLDAAATELAPVLDADPGPAIVALADAKDGRPVGDLRGGNGSLVFGLVVRLDREVKAALLEENLVPMSIGEATICLPAS
jgi:hypothetical protein